MSQVHGPGETVTGSDCSAAGGPFVGREKFFMQLVVTQAQLQRPYNTLDCALRVRSAARESQSAAEETEGLGMKTWSGSAPGPGAVEPIQPTGRHLQDRTQERQRGWRTHQVTVSFQ